MKDGYQVLKSNKSIFSLLWIGIIFTLIYIPISALFPLMSIGHFGGTEKHVAAAEIIYSTGMTVGGLLLGLVGRKIKNRGTLIILSLILMGAATGICGLLPSNGYVIFAVMCSVMGFAASFYSGPQMSLMQEKIEPQFLGRAFGLYGSLMSFAMPLGLILSGLFADQVGISNWFFASGLMCIELGIVGFSLKHIKNTEI